MPVILSLPAVYPPWRASSRSEGSQPTRRGRAGQFEFPDRDTGSQNPNWLTPKKIGVMVLCVPVIGWWPRKSEPTTADVLAFVNDTELGFVYTPVDIFVDGKSVGVQKAFACFTFGLQFTVAEIAFDWSVDQIRLFTRQERFEFVTNISRWAVTWFRGEVADCFDRDKPC